MIGTLKPASVASKISAIEAVRYTESGTDFKSKRSATRNKVASMALRNAFRDKKRTCVVVLSMFLGITIFLSVTSMLTALKAENFLRDYVTHDFSIENSNPFNTMGDDVKISQINQEITDTIGTLDGIDNLFYTTIGLMTLDYTPDFYDYIDEKLKEFGVSKDEKITSLWGFVIGIDGDDITQSEDNANFQFDVEAFNRGEFALFEADAIENLLDIKTITVDINESGESVDIKMNGFVSREFMRTMMSFGPNIFVSKQYLKSISPGTPPIYRASFDADDALESAIDERLAQYFNGNYSYSYESRLQIMKDFNSMKQSINIIGNGVSLVLASIGVLNFVNIICTGIMTRRHELALLESIGMSKKQIRKMNLLEGLWYFLITAVLSSTAGSGIAYAMVALFKHQATYAVFEFPLIPLIITLTIILAVCVITPAIAYKTICKGTAVERLRET